MMGNPKVRHRTSGDMNRPSVADDHLLREPNRLRMPASSTAEMSDSPRYARAAEQLLSRLGRAFAAAAMTIALAVVAGQSPTVQAQTITVTVELTYAGNQATFTATGASGDWWYKIVNASTGCTSSGGLGNYQSGGGSYSRSFTGHAGKYVCVAVRYSNTLHYGVSGAITYPPDNTAPTVTAAEVNGTKLVVTFSEPLASTKAVDNAWTVTVAGSTRSITGYTLSDRTATLTLSSAVAGGQTVSLAYAKQATGNKLQDTANNDLASFTGQVVENNANKVDGRAIDLTYNGNQVTFSVHLSTQSSSVRYAIVNSPDDCRLGVTLIGQSVQFSPYTRTITGEAGKYICIANRINIGGGGTNTAYGTAGPIVYPPDNTAPTVASASVNGTALSVTFSENMLSTKAAEGAWSVSVAGTSVSVTSYTLSGRNADLVLASAAVQNQNVTLGYTQPTGNADKLQDVAGNLLATFSSQSVTNNTPADTTAPTVTVATVDGATLTVTFDENMSTTKAVDSAWSVSVAGSTVSVTSYTLSGSTAVLTLASAAVNGDTVTLGYTKPSSGNKLQDISGNDLATFSSQSVSNTTDDVTAPTVTAAEINGTKLVVTFSEPLAGTKAVNSAWTVTADGSSKRLSSYTLSGSTATLTLASAVTLDQTVTLGFTRQGGGNTLKDVAGNELETFSSQSVANETFSIILSETQWTIVEDSTVQTAPSTIRLSHQPTGTVTIRIRRANASHPYSFGYSNGGLEATFNQSNWNTAVPIEEVYSGYNQFIYIGNDSNAVDETYMVPVTASGGGYDDVATSITLTVLDNDISRPTPPSNPVQVAPGGTTTFDIVLSQSPGAAGQTVTLTPPAGSGVSLNPSTLTFTQSNWQTPQTVRAQTSSNTFASSETILITISPRALTGATMALQGLSSLSLSTSTLSVVKGNTATFNVKLAAQPSSDRTVTLTTTSSDITIDTDAGTSGNQDSLTFTSADWNTDQAVTVTAVASPSGTSATITATGTQVASAEIAVSILNAPPPSGMIRLTYPQFVFLPFFATDATQVEFYVHLDTAPNADVTVNIANDNPYITVSPTTLTFTPSSYAQADRQTVTATRVEDPDFAHDSYTLTLSATGGIDAPDLVQTSPIRDGDVTWIFDTDHLVIVEGTSTTVRARLPFQPASDVGSQFGLGHCATHIDTRPNSPGYQTSWSFTSDTWDQWVTFSVTAEEEENVGSCSADLATTDDMSRISINGTRGAGGGLYESASMYLPVTIIDNDSGAPVVSGATISGSGATLTVTFNEAMSSTKATNSAWMVGVDGSPVSVSSYTLSGTSAVLTLASTVLEGQAVTLGYTKPGSGNTLQDAGGSDLATFRGLRVTNPDTTIPTVTDASVDGDTLIVTFSEIMATPAPDRRTWWVSVDSVRVNVSSHSHQGSAIRLNLASAVTESQTVTLSFTQSTTGDTTKLRDTANNNVVNFSNRAVTNNTDSTPPTVASASANGTVLTVTFNENLADDKAADTAWSVNVAGSAVSVSSYAISGADAVITLASAVSNGDTVTVSYTKPGSGDVLQDAKGNEVATFSAQSVTNDTPAAPDDTVPTVTALSVNRTDLTVTFSETMSGTKAADTAWTVNVDGSARSITGYTIAGTTAVLTLSSTATQGQEVTLAYTKPGSGDVLQDAAGNELATFAARTVTNTTPDITAPTVTAASVDGASLTVTFSENLASTKANDLAWAVNVAGSVRSITGYTISDSTAVLTLSSAVEFGQTVTLGYTQRPAEDRLQDAAGNEVANFADQAVTNATPDPSAPTVTAASVSGSTLTVTFMTALSSAKAANSAWVVTVAGNTRSVSSYTLSGSTAVLTLASRVNDGETVTLGYTKPSSGNKLQGATGSDVETFADLSVTNNTESVAPTVTALSVNGATLTVTFSETMASTKAADTAWAVLVAGSARSVSSYTLSGSTAVLTLASAVTDGQPVSLAYNQPSGAAAKLQDPSDNPLASFAPRTVTNNTDTVTPTVTGLNVNGATLTVTFSEAMSSTKAADSAWAVVVAGSARSVSSYTLSGSTATLTLASAVTDGQTVSLAYTQPSGAADKLQDPAGNELASFAARTVTNDTDTVAPTITIASVSGSSLTLTFSETVFLSGIGPYISQQYFNLSAGGSTIRVASSFQAPTQGASTVTMPLAGAVTDGQTVTMNHNVPGHIPVFADGAGNRLANFSNVSVTNATDTTAPTVMAASVDRSTLTVTFSETLASTKAADSAWVVNVAGSTRSFSGYTLSGSTAVFTLGSDVAEGETVTLSYTKPGSGNVLQDAVGNELADFSNRNVTNNTDTTAPTVSSASINGSTLTLTLSEPVSYDRASDVYLAPAFFYITVGGSNIDVRSYTQPRNQRTVTFEMRGTVTDGQTVTLTQNIPVATASFKDASDNYLANFSNLSVTNTTDTTAPTIQAASVDGATLTVTFSETMAGTRAANSAWTVNVAGSPVSISSYTLAGDKAILTLANPVTRSQSLTLSYSQPGGTASKLRDPAGNLLGSVSNRNVTNNTSAPSIVGITRLTPNSSPTQADSLTWRVDFSTMMSNVDNSDFTVTGNGGSLGSPGLTATQVSSSNDMWDVGLSGGNLENYDGTITLALASNQNITDGAGEALSSTLPADAENTYVLDHTAPTVTSASVAGTALTVTFSEDMSSTKAADSAWAVSVAGSAVSVSSYSISDDTATLTLASAAAFGQAVTIGYTRPTGSADKLQDVVGNELASFSGRNVTNNAPDPAAPTVTAASVNGSALSVTFSVAMAATKAADSAWMVSAGGSPISVTSYTLSGTSASLTLASAVTGGQDVTLGYSKPTSGNTLQDTSGNELASFSNQNVSNSTTDNIRPTVVSATIKGDRLTLNMSESVSITIQGTYFNTQNFGYYVPPSTAIITSRTYPVFSNGGRTVSFTMYAGVDAGQTVLLNHTLGTPAPHIPASNHALRDSSNNTMANFTGFSVTNITETDSTAPTVSAASVDGATLTVTFSEAMSRAKTASSAWMVDVGGSARSVSSYTLSGSTAILTLSAPVGNSERITLGYTKPASGNMLQDAYGNALASFSSRNVTNNTADSTAPTFLSAGYSGSTVTVTFSEAMANIRAAGTVWSVGSSGVSSLIRVTSYTLSGATATLNLDTSLPANSNVTMSYIKPASGNRLQDTSGNELEDFYNRTVLNADAPSVTAASVNGTALTVTFDENLASTKAADSAWSASVAGSSVSVSSYTISGATAVLTLASAAGHDDVVTLGYTQPSSGNVLQDADGNEVETFSSRNVTNNTPDTTAPTVTSAVIDGATLTVTFSELVTADSFMGVGWNARVAGASVGYTNSLSTTEPTLTLTLSTPVTPTQTVTISYGLPGNTDHRLKDDAGNELAAFNNRSVTNNTLYTLVLSPAALRVEKGRTATVNVKLSSQPAANVDVTLTHSGSDITIDTDSVTNGNQDSLTFTSANWNTDQSVAITASANPASSRVTVASNDADGDIARAELIVTIAEPTYEFEVENNVSSLLLTAGEPQTIGIRLREQPNRNINVSLGGTYSQANSSLTPNPVSVTFTPSNWNVYQDITLTGTNTSPANQDTGIVHNVSFRGGGISNGGGSGRTINVEVLKGIALTLNKYVVNVEDGGSETFTVRLASQPGQNTIARQVHFSSDNSNVTLSPTSATFTATNWNSPQTVTVTSTMDADRLNDTATISLSGRGTTSTSLRVIVEDAHKLTLNPASLVVDEGGSGTFTVQMADQPASSKTVRLSSNRSEVTLDTSTLTFTSTDWNTAQTVTVSAAADSDSSNNTSTITLVGDAGDLTIFQTQLTVTSEEPSALTLSDTSLAVDEGASGTFTVQLASQPLGNRQISLSSNNADVTIDTDTGAAGNQVMLDFTRTNWNTAQTVTISAAADADTDDDSATVTLSGTGIAQSTVAVSVKEAVVANRNRNFIIADEGTSTSDFTYVLESQPLGDRTITLVTTHSHLSMATGGGTPAKNLTLTFTSSNWDTPQAVSLTVGEDGDHNDQTAYITSTLGAHLARKGSQTDSITVRLRDNDSNRTMVLGGTPLTINEGGSGTFTVRLKANLPAGTKSASLTTNNSSVTVSPTSLNFNSGNWNNPQTITVTSAGDTDTEDTDVIITLSDPNGTVIPNSTTVRVLESVQAVRNKNFIIADEGSTTADFTYVLNAQPAADNNGDSSRTIGLSTSHADLTIATGAGAASQSLTLTFDASNWNTPQTVTLNVAEDADKDDRRATINVTLGTRLVADSRFGGNISVNMRDNDMGLTLADAPLNVNESATGTFTVQLDGQPSNHNTSKRTVSLASTNSDVTLSPSSLEFTNSDWNSPKMVTVTAAEDADANDDTATINLTGDNVQSASTTVKVFENIETTRSKNFIIVDEGTSTANFTYVLDSQPSSDRTIEVATTHADLTVATGTGAASRNLTLTFTPDNWSTAQTVTVSAAEDADNDDREGRLITFTLGDGLAHSGSLGSNLLVQVRDNDMGFVLSDAPTDVTEGSTARFKVKLNGAPSRTRAVTLASDNINIAFTPSSLDFEKDMGSTDQTVTISVTADADTDDGTAAINISGDGLITSSTTVNVLEAIEAFRNTNILTADEGTSTATFNYVLESQPDNDRTITASTANSDVTLSTAGGAASQSVSLTFTSNNWNTAQSIAVTVAEDSDANDSLADINFDLGEGLVHKSGVTAALPVHLRDNDIALSIAGATQLNILEGGSDTFDVNISGQPPVGIDRVVTLASDNTDVTFSPATLTFTSSNWVTAQTVTVTTAADSDVIDDTATITLSSPSMTSITASVSVFEEVEASRNRNFMIADEGTSASTFTYVLESQPSSNRVLILSTSDSGLTLSTGGGAASGTLTLTFTPNNWSTAQTVTVSAAQDPDRDDLDGQVNVAFGPGLTHADGTSYRLIVLSRDNDMRLATSTANLPMTENASATFGVKLNGQPVNNRDRQVTLSSDNTDVTIDTDPDTAGDQNTLTFTSGNWNTDQTVTVSAARDNTSDDETAIVTITSGSNHPLPDASVTVMVEEDIALYRDRNFIVVDEGDANGATFNIRLTSQPNSDRIVSLVASDSSAVTITPTPVTFTADNWGTDQTITVVANDDDDTDSKDVYVNFNGVGFTANHITARVRDDDVKLTLSPESLVVMEGDGGSFTVKLAAQPPLKDDRTVTLTSDNSDITFDTDPNTAGPQSTLTFTGADDGNWDTPQTVTVSTVSDSDANDAVAMFEFTGVGVATDSLTVTAAETVGLSLADAPLDVTEGGSGTFKVKLAAQIAGERIVSLAPNHNGITLSPTSLIFDSSNWNTEQTVTVDAATDSDAIDNSVTVDLTGAGLTPASTTVTALELIEAARDQNFIIADEGTSTSTFQYVLETRPSGNRTIAVSTTHADLTLSTGGGAASQNLTLTFTPSNWNVPQVVTASVAHDADSSDRNEYVDFTLGAGLGHKSGVDARLRVQLRDDDMGLILTPAALSINEGLSETFTVRLTSQPPLKDDRTVTLSSSNPDVTVTPSSLSFSGNDGGNWNSPQIVTVSTIADADSVNNSAVISFSGAGISDSTLNLTVFETVDLILSDTSLSIEENGTGTFTVAFSSRPTGNRTIDLMSNNPDVTFSPASLTFQSSAWNSPQTVTLSAVQDSDNANDSAVISLFGAGVTMTSTNVTVTEGIPLIRSRNVVTVDEGDATGSSFTIRLSSQPSTDKTVSVLSSHPDVTVSPATVTFTAADWQTDRTITATAAEDADSTDRAVLISFDSAGVASQHVTANVRDDEMDLSLSKSTLTIDELGSGTFTVQLGSSMISPRTLNLTSDNADVTLDPASLEFNSENWNSPRTVTVSASADSDTLNDSARIDVDGVSVQPGSLAVTVIDGTSARLTLSATSLDIIEGGTRSFTVRLASQPNGNRTVNLTSQDTNITFTPTSLTFTGGAGGDWATEQGVTINAFQDDDTINNPATISLAGTDVAGASISVSVIDDDPVELTLSSASLRVDEGSSASFTVQLASEPNGLRTIRLTSDNSDLSFTPASLEFRAGDWNQAQTVRVSAASDANTVDETSSISLAGTLVTTASLPVTVADDDSVRLILSDTSLTIDEDSTTTLSIKLATQPNTDSTVIMSSTNADVVLSVRSLDFTTSNWDTAQNVTITTRSDDDTTNDPATIRLSGVDISPLFVPVTVTDDDPVALTLSRTSLNLDEGGSATFTVQLASEPNGERTVNLTSDDSNITFDSASLTFAPDNWETPQMVTLSAARDADAANSSANIGFSGTLVTAASLAVTVVDNDSVGLSLSASSLRIDEEGTGIFSLRLSEQISTDRVVTLAGSDGSDLFATPASVTFTASDWNAYQIVTISARADDDTDDDMSAIEFDGTGVTSASLAVTVIDNDPNALVVSATSLTIDENDSTEITVQLGSRPNSNRTVTLASDNADVTVSPASLSFSSGNWDAPQTVTVTTAMDDDSANSSAEITISGTLLTTALVSVTVADDDPIGLTLSATDLTLNENSSTTFTVQLAADVGVDRTVNLASDSDKVTFSPASLSFATGSQLTPQTVTVTAAKDEDTVNDTANITLSGALITDATVAVTATDTDSVGLIISKAELAADEGEGDTFTVQLAAAVSKERTITLASNYGRLTLEPTTLTFEPGNWDAPQTVTATSDSDSDKRDDAATITFSGVDVSTTTLLMEITDDDLGLILSVNRLEIDEGQDETFTVQLNTQPRATRTLNLVAANVEANRPVPVSLSPAQLSFTSENWDTPQTVTVTALQDGNPASDFATIDFNADNVKARPLSVRVIDDANIGLTLTGAPVEVTEGRTATFTVQLTAQPTTARSITLASDNRDVIFSPEKLDFSVLGWDEPQTITVRADHDGDALNETATLTLEGTGITTTPVTVNIIDDDPVGLILSHNTMKIREGQSVVLSVELDRATSVDRTIEFVPETEFTNVTLDPQRLFFPAEEWNVAQTVTVTAVQDENTSDETGVLYLRGINVIEGRVTIEIDDDDDGAFPEEETEAAKLLLAEVAGTVLPAASDTIHLRINAARDQRSATVAGQQITLNRSLASDLAAGFASRAGVDSTAQSRFAQDRFGAERQSADWLGGVLLENGRPVRTTSERSSGASSRDAMLSSFSYAFNPGEGPQSGGGWSVWGRVETSEFSGLNEEVEFDGSQNNIWLGFDRRSDGGTLTGMALSLSSSDADYTLGRFGASIQTDLSLVLPYLEISSESGSSGLVMIGLGSGQATLTQTNKVEGVADLQMHLMSIGGDWPAAQFKNSMLSWATELGFTRLQTVESELPVLADLSIDSAQFRGGLELTHNGFGSFTKVSPRIGLMLRHDAGDGITGTGVELTAGLQINSPLNRFSLDINLRTLGSHTAEELSDWGASLQFRINSRPDGSGLGLSLGPHWGTADTGLLEQEDAFQLSDADLQRRREQQNSRGVAANLAYGLRALGGMLTPYSEFNFTSGDAGSTRQITGVRFNGSGTLELRLFSERQISSRGESRSRVAAEIEKQF